MSNQAILIDDDLSFTVDPSLRMKMREHTHFVRGRHFIHGPVIDKIEESLDGKGTIMFSGNSKKKYDAMCRVTIKVTIDGYLIVFNKYPSRPWFIRNDFDYYKWTTTCVPERSSGISSRPTIYRASSRYQLKRAIEILQENGYDVHVPDLVNQFLYPRQFLEDDVAEIQHAKTNVTLKPHQSWKVDTIVSSNRHCFAIADDAGLGKCLHEDTLIVTCDGYVKPINEIFEERIDNMIQIGNDEWIAPCTDIHVPSYDGITWKPTKAENIYRQKINAPMITIKTASGRTITSTLNHKFYTFDPTKGGVWIKSSDLKENDRIALPTNLPLIENDVIKPVLDECFTNHNSDGTIVIRRNKSSTPQKSIITPKIMSSDFFEFMGWMLAEGSEGDYGSNQKISLHQHDNDILDRFGYLFKANFNIDPIIDKINHTTFVSSVTLVEFFKSIGYEFGFKAKDKRFPNWILTAPMDLMNTCLRAYFDGDGHFSKQNGVLEVSSASKRLIHQAYYMLLRNGIISSYAEKIVGKSLGLSNPHYTLRITSIGELQKFADLIGFSLNRKMNDLTWYLRNKSEGVRYNYGIPIDKNLFRSIREKLFIYQRDMNVSRSLVVGIEQRGRCVSRKNFLKILSSFLSKINLFNDSITIIQNSKTWNDLINIMKSLNVDKRDLVNAICVKINSFYHYVKKEKINESFNRAKNYLISVCNDATLLRSNILKIYHDVLNNYYDPIKSIIMVPRKEQYVYDLYVPETNNFVASNGIMCHNTITVGEALVRLWNEGKVKRVLWVVPTAQLTDQIRGELKEKFQIDAITVTGGNMKRMTRLGIERRIKERIKDKVIKEDVKIHQSIYEKHAFIITTWGVFIRDWKKDVKFTQHVPFDAVVFDEGHRVSEGNASWTSATNVVAPIRFLLSGSIAPNGKWNELHDSMSIVDVGEYPSKMYFNSEQRRRVEHKLKNPSDAEYKTELEIENEVNRILNKILYTYLKPRILRNTKADDGIREDLPKLKETKIHVSLSSEEGEILELFIDVIGEMLEELKYYGRNPWSMDKKTRDEYFFKRTAMMLVWQDVRRFCSFGGDYMKNRIDDIKKRTKPVHDYLLDKYKHAFVITEKLFKKGGVRIAPKNDLISDWIDKNITMTDRIVIFCSSPRRATDFGMALRDDGYPAKVILGQGNRLTDDESEELEQDPTFKEQDTENVINWFWYPWSDIFRFVLQVRDLGAIIEGKDRDGTPITNFFYTNLPNYDRIQMIVKRNSVSDMTWKRIKMHVDELVKLTIPNECEFLSSIPSPTTITITFVKKKMDKRMLITTDALVEGINLQNANIVIFYDFPFSIRQREQRLSRIWRMGSVYPSVALICLMNGIEYSMEKSLKAKYYGGQQLGFTDPEPMSMTDMMKILKREIRDEKKKRIEDRKHKKEENAKKKNQLVA